MKKYNFIITGAINASVMAEDEESAERALEVYLEDNSPIRGWCIDSDIDGDYESIDIELDEIKSKLEYLRGEIREERISYAGIAELQSLYEHVDKDDVELLQWAGVIPDDGDGNLVAPVKTTKE